MEHSKKGGTWFLAQFKSNSHQIAQRNLRRQNFQTFLPMHEETKRKSGQFTTTLRPLFAGYLFVGFDTSKGGWRTINSTYGVTNLVSFGGKPQPVPLDLISSLMLRCDDSGKLMPPPVFKAGDAVKISSGPFAEFGATVEEVTSGQRIWVLLELMGQTTRVAMHPEGLQVL